MGDFKVKRVITYNATWLLTYLLVGCAGYNLAISKPELAGKIDQAQSGPIIPQGSTRETFTQDDPYAFVLIELKDLIGEHELRWRWVDPKGNVYVETPPSLLGKKGLRYPNIKVSHKIKIEGERAAGLPGRWKVQLVLDGQPAAERGFQILVKLDDTPPEIVILSPGSLRDLTPKPIVYQETQSIIGIAQDASGIARIMINDVLAEVFPASKEEMQKAGLRGDGVKFMGEVQLRSGENSILVKAVDKRGNEAKKVKSITYQVPDLGKKGYYDKSWAVVIGINDYDRWPRLEYAVNDAQSVSKKLKAAGFDEVIEILDKDATRAKILSLLGDQDQLPAKVRENDRLVIFFAGHGQTEKLAGGEQGYIIPVDASMTGYFSSAISMEQVRDLSKRIPAKHILYAMDSCYSGLGFSRASGIDPKVSGYIEVVANRRSVQMITAGGRGEQAMEKNGHGIFTEYLLRGLDGEADSNNDGVITASELGAYVPPRVSNASNNRQTPLFGRLDGEGEMLFIYKK